LRKGRAEAFEFSGAGGSAAPHLDRRERPSSACVLFTFNEGLYLKASYRSGANRCVRNVDFDKNSMRAVQELGLCWPVRNQPPLE
jgi:hypothetical protein